MTWKAIAMQHSCITEVWKICRSPADTRSILKSQVKLMIGLGNTPLWRIAVFCLFVLPIQQIACNGRISTFICVSRSAWVRPVCFFGSLITMVWSKLKPDLICLTTLHRTSYSLIFNWFSNLSSSSVFFFSFILVLWKVTPLGCWWSCVLRTWASR